MLRTVLRSLPTYRRTWKPLVFTQTDFEKLPVNEPLEEEYVPNYVPKYYYPAHIGQMFQERYQIVGKFGFGATATAWLARDFKSRLYVTLKICVTSDSLRKHWNNERQTYDKIEKASKLHPGRDAIRPLINSFEIKGPNGNHICLVHSPLWENLIALKLRNPGEPFPSVGVAHILKRLFLALDLLHTECHVIHTDINADIIMLGLSDDTVLEQFEQDELDEPCPRKVLDGRTIYPSRILNPPDSLGEPILCDFDSAVSGEIEHTEDVSPDTLRAPEIILKIPWTYSIDIWSTACMVWYLFQSEHLFEGHDQEHNAYRSRSHLAEIINVLGPPPPELLARAKLRNIFFTDKGVLSPGATVPDPTTLEERMTALEGEDKVMFLRLMRKMLQWEPEKRSTAKELLEDEWICKYVAIEE